MSLFADSLCLGRVAAALLLCFECTAAEIAHLTLDCAKPNGTIRALHSSNGGPVAFGGMVDLSERHREIGFPLMRLHDCQWPEPAVVDIHTVFRDFRNDPSAPENYYFARTDDYIDAILQTGAKVFYRLGESIEHTRRKYDVHPPTDYDKWAAVCMGIVRHYNEGWANGFHHGIQYWEIWNEPDVRPHMWSGTDADYYRLYETTVKAIKRSFPDVKVGGPAAGNAGEFHNGIFEPVPFVAGFLKYCNERNLPLDFFSWHRYTDDPQELAARARGVREMLDRLGFVKTESHLNEWNYLPRQDWNIFVSGTPEARERWYAEMAGPAGAAFTCCALIALQDVPIDMAYFYTSGTDGFGLFSPHGVPNKTFYALKAFRLLLESPNRISMQGSQPGRLMGCGGLNEARDTLTFLLSNYRTSTDTVRISFRNLPWRGPTKCTVTRIDSGRDWETNILPDLGSPDSALEQELKTASLLLVKLSPSTKP